MRTKRNIDESLLAEARRLTGIEKRTALIHEGLRALIARESPRRLALLGGTEPRIKTTFRRRRVRSLRDLVRHIPKGYKPGESDWGTGPS